MCYQGQHACQVLLALHWPHEILEEIAVEVLVGWAGGLKSLTGCVWL